VTTGITAGTMVIMNLAGKKDPQEKNGGITKSLMTISTGTVSIVITITKVIT